MSPPRRFLALLLVALCATLWAPAANARPPVPPDSAVGAASAIIYDMENGAVLFEQNADEPIPPASLTKVMSMFLALDHIRNGKASLDSLVPISAAAASTGGSVMGIRSGELIPLRKLLLGMAVSSGNDASHAVAEYVGGSAEAFVRQMNERAAALGMRGTHFENPHGLPAAGQVTTARDMLAVARAYLEAHPGSLALHNTRVMEHGGYSTWNKNPLLGQYEGADGLKTGWIRASGHNLIFTAKRGNRRLLGVILGAMDANWRGAEACRLLDAGFRACAGDAPTVQAALDETPVDLNRVDILKTAREAGIKPRHRQYSPRLLAARKALEKYLNGPIIPRTHGKKALAEKRIPASRRAAARAALQGKPAQAAARSATKGTTAKTSAKNPSKGKQAKTAAKKKQDQGKRKSHADRSQRQARRG